MDLMFNKAMLTGRITAEPELKQTQNNIPVLSFRLAVEREYGKKDEEKQVDFINCVAWRHSANYLGKYAHKGDLIGVEGKIQTRNYPGQDGKTVYVTEILVDHTEILANANRKQSEPQQTAQTQQQTYSQGFDDSFGNFDNSPTLDISSDDLPF